jgi:glycosyltransferase involved in cell wall biosynthesis
MKMKMKKNIAIIGTVGIPAKYGGFETLTEHLVSNLSDKFNFTVYCSKKKYTPEEQLTYYKRTKLEYINLEANGMQSIIYDAISILKALKNHEILLILGVAGAWILPFVKWFTNKKIIVSIDGIEWKRDKWSTLAKLYLFWAEKTAIKYSHFDISDNESIQDYTAIRYQTLSRVIEYGADHTVKIKPEIEDRIKYSFICDDYAIKVCRIEPENNIEMVLEAFAIYKKLNLIVVGNWDNSAYGKKLKAKYKPYSNLHLFDPIYNHREIDLIRGNATFYVHGHSAGGTNPSLVEAMYLGLPIMAFGVSYNKTTTENKALYFSTTKNLVTLIEKTNPNVLSKVSKSMKIIADKRYTWSIVANKYNQLFNDVLTLRNKFGVYNGIELLDQKILDEFQLAHLKHTNLFYEKR